LISELQDSIRLTKAGESNPNAKVTEAMEKVKTLENEKNKMKRDCDAVEEEYALLHLAVCFD
jgi:hypothetical protein